MLLPRDLQALLLLPPLAALEAKGPPAGLPAHPAHLALAQLASSQCEGQTPEWAVLDLAFLGWESTPAGVAQLATFLLS